VGTLTWLWWVGGIFIATIAFLVWVLAFCPTWTRDPDTPEPEPALQAAQHRARDAGDLDVQHWRSFTDTVPNIRLAAIAEAAERAIDDIPADPERTAP